MTGQKKGPNILGGLIDLFVLVLLVGGAAFFGYFIGINQKLAPIQLVAPGTPGAIMPGELPSVVSPAATEANAATTTTTSTTASTPASTAPAASSKPAISAASTPAAPAKGKMKFWLASSGSDYVGHSITVKVNDQPVDNFFGPGKTLDITRFVKKGKNSIVFECKALEDYNKHTGDKNFALTVQLVSGPTVRDDFAPSAVLLSCRRTAAETKDATENYSFESKE